MKRSRTPSISVTRLELFLTDARIPIHNNASERRLRVVALGRKNCLFVGHPRAGRNIAAVYSLVGCCIANRIEPTEYLTDVLPRIAQAKTEAELDALLPDRWRPSRPRPPDTLRVLCNHGAGQTVTLVSLGLGVLGAARRLRRSKSAGQGARDLQRWLAGRRRQQE